MPTMEAVFSTGVITSVLWSGISLCVTDLFFDLRYILAPPDKVSSRRRQALDYYENLLTPRLHPFPYPGWIFAFACSVYLLFGLPCVQHFAMAVLYFPICIRYSEIMSGFGDRALRDWHWVVAIRFVLLALGMISLSIHTGWSLDAEQVTGERTNLR